MTAIDEARAADGTEKSTRDGSQPSVGDATRAAGLPQLPYGDAVHAALAGAGLVPDTLETGVRVEGQNYGAGRRELFLRLEWLPGHEDLADVHRQAGMTLAWSHLAGGWSFLFGDDLVVLDLDELAAPDLIAEAVLTAAVDGFGMVWTAPPGAARWEYAPELDIALVHFDQREATR